MIVHSLHNLSKPRLHEPIIVETLLLSNGNALEVLKASQVVLSFLFKVEKALLLLEKLSVTMVCSDGVHACA